MLLLIDEPGEQHRGPKVTVMVKIPGQWARARVLLGQGCEPCGPPPLLLRYVPLAGREYLVDVDSPMWRYLRTLTVWVWGGWYAFLPKQAKIRDNHQQTETRLGGMRWRRRLVGKYLGGHQPYPNGSPDGPGLWVLSPRMGWIIHARPF